MRTYCFVRFINENTILSYELLSTLAMTPRQRRTRVSASSARFSPRRNRLKMTISYFRKRSACRQCPPVRKAQCRWRGSNAESGSFYSRAKSPPLVFVKETLAAYSSQAMTGRKRFKVFLPLLRCGQCPHNFINAMSMGHWMPKDPTPCAKREKKKK